MIMKAIFLFLLSFPLIQAHDGHDNSKKEKATKKEVKKITSKENWERLSQHSYVMSFEVDHLSDDAKVSDSHSFNCRSGAGNSCDMVYEVKTNETNVSIKWSAAISLRDSAIIAMCKFDYDFVLEKDLGKGKFKHRAIKTSGEASHVLRKFDNSRIEIARHAQRVFYLRVKEE